MPDAILTVPEAAKLLKVCDKTLYTWCQRQRYLWRTSGGPYLL